MEFSFGDSPSIASELLALVIAGRKVATCSALSSFLDRPLAIPGEQQIILNEHGQKACLIEITAVDLVKFKDVDADFAIKEGEGDLSLEAWRTSHRRYFERAGCFEPDMILVCEQFRVAQIF